MYNAKVFILEHRKRNGILCFERKTIQTHAWKGLQSGNGTKTKNTSERKQ